MRFMKVHFSHYFSGSDSTDTRPLDTPLSSSLLLIGARAKFDAYHKMKALDKNVTKCCKFGKMEVLDEIFPHPGVTQ